MAQATPSTSKPIEDVKEEPPVKGRPRRRGQGSKQKRAEAFRQNKNKQFESELNAKIESIKINLGYSAQEIFGDRTISSIIHPPKEVKINTDTVGDLCDLLAEILHGACKIPPPQASAIDETIAYDSETLMWVTALQIEAKMQRARSNSSFPPSLDVEVEMRVQRTELLLSKALAPLAIYIEQIGRFDVDGQMFIPGYSGIDFSYHRLFDSTNPCTSYIRGLTSEQSGVMLPRYGPDGRRLFLRPLVDNEVLVDRRIMLADGNVNPAFIEHPDQFQWFGVVEVVPGAAPQMPLTFEVIVSRYVDLQSRINKKLSNVLVDIDFRAKGNESQIVYCDDGDGLVNAWSPRKIRADAFEMGAILKLGYRHQSFGHPDMCASVCTIDRAGGLHSLAGIITKKIK